MTDKTMTLEPCPFCGGEAEITWEACDLPGFDGKSWSASCRGNVDEDCFASNHAQFKKREYAIQAWNKRTRHLSQPAERGDAQEKAEPVGEAYTMQTSKRHTMAVFDCLEVPAGTKLYTAPPPAASVPDAEVVLAEYVRICVEEHTDRAGPEHRVKAMERAISKAMLSAAPSPTIDVAAVREVIAELIDYDEADGEALNEWADKLARAIGDAK